MNRSIHRKITAHHKKYKSKRGIASFNVKEAFLLQCIISGIILAFVLCVSLIDVPLTRTIKRTLSAALSESVEPESIKTALEESADNLTAMKDSFLTIFSDKDDNTVGVFRQSPPQNTAKAAELPTQTPAQPTASPIATPITQTPPPSFFNGRIDEDILTELNSKEDIYTENVKNRQAPSLSATSERN